MKRNRWPIAVCLAMALAVITACGTSHTSNYQPPPQEAKVSITPQNASALINQTVQFSATVTGTTNTAVKWSVKEETGGTVSAGLYQAPNLNGTYHVTATSLADSSKSATAEVAISAFFVFLQRYDQGNAQPYSMTPLVGSFGPDRKYSSSNVIDSTTGKPISLSLMDAFPSSDGTKAVFTQLDTFTDSSGSPYYIPNIYTANADGSNIVNLTNYKTPGPWALKPQFTPNGKQIIYNQGDYTASCTAQQVWMMNTDGTNPHVVFDACAVPYWIGFLHPTVSPDGTRIAVQDYQYDGTYYYQGIAVMNFDGSNFVQLTGNTSTETCPNGAYFIQDENPSFSHDSKTVVFDRVCATSDYYAWFAAIYSVQIDGSNLAVLFNDNTGGMMNEDPLVVADRVVFSSNRGKPNTQAFDMYSINRDGSGLTRLTENNTYDNFTTDLMNWWSSASSKGAFALQNPLDRIQKRVEELKHQHGH